MRNESTSSCHPGFDFLLGGGEMGMRIREKDWSKTSLGPPESWQQSLKTAVRIMLTSRQAMFVWWGEELINLYNDAYRAIVGGKHPEALGQPASVVWREIWDQVAPRAESAILQNEGTYDEALLLIMERNGYPEETYYTFSYSPVPNDQGGTGGILCANTDDTQRIIGERQLALLRELAAKTADARTFDEACTRSASCLETNPYDLPFALIYLVDPDQQCVFLAGTCGIERGHPAVPEVVALDDNTVWPFAEVMNTSQLQQITHLETLGDFPTGAWQHPPHQAVAVPIAPSGQTGKAGILVAGLNPFRLFDNNYHRFIDLVAAQIAASIANANAYEEERKRAEALAELDRAKTAFFSNISHEFRTPLTLMLGPLEDLLTTEVGLSDHQRQPIELVHRNSLRLLKLVNTLLDFSRIEAGRIQALYQPTDLATLTIELASVFRSAIERAGLRFIVECEPTAEPVYVDRDMWEKIVLNLLSNAFKFTFTGEIAVRLRQVEHQIELTVRDTGTGIPTAELPNLFKRFHRVQGAQSRTHEGSGIGLALVQELVRLHSGEVKVESIEGKGTTFHVSLPTGKAHLPPDQAQAHPTSAVTTSGAAPYIEEALRWLPEESTAAISPESLLESRPPTPLASSTARILLVDDNADMRDYVKRLLHNRYQVEAVGDGLAALEAIRTQLPDLVLTDVMMPRLDGFGLLRALRSDDRTREIPIILLSARAGEEAQVEGLEAGADDYLIKPFNARELIARVNANLDMAQLRQEAARREQQLRAMSEVAQQAAETARDQVSNILESITDAFVAFDRQWRYAYVNRAASQILQQPPENLIGKHVWQEVFPNEIGGLAYHNLHLAMNERIPVSWEEFGQPLQRWLEVNAYPFADGIAIYFRDITERKQAEVEHEQLMQALAIEQARLEAVLRQLPVGVMIADAASGKLVLTNEQAKQIVGYNYDESLMLDQYDPIVSFEGFHPTGQRYAAEDYPLVRSLQQGEVVTNEEIELHRNDGCCIFINANSAPILDGGGEIVSAVVVFQDVTERKRAETALQEGRDRLTLLYETTRDLLLSDQPLTLIHSLFSKLKDQFGLDVCLNYLLDTEQQMLRLAAYEGISDSLAAEIECLDLGRAVCGTVAQQCRQIVHADVQNSTDATVEFVRSLGLTAYACQPLAVQSQVFGTLGFGSRTRTQFTTAEVELLQVLCDQIAIAMERASLITSLQQQTEQLRQANQIKDEFLAVLSHELRSPLNPILGWTKLLRMGKLDQQKTAIALETIERNAQLQTQLIGDLLDISRILQGKLALDIRSVDLASTISAALETVRLAAEAKSIQIQISLDPTIPMILGDGNRLQQVVWNLLSNAIKFTPDGGRVEVKLDCLAADEFAANHTSDNSPAQNPEYFLRKRHANRTQNAKPVAQITVTDTGKGIHPDFLPYVFDSFRQADGSTTRKFGGLGLGLAIVRQIVELHGGTVTATSPGEDQGATFTVKLPLSKLGETKVQSTDRFSTAFLPTPSLKGVKILVVDDEADTRELIAFTLKQCEATVRAVESAAEALIEIASFQPDLLMSDIGMPEMDGYMLMQQIRKLPPEQGGQIPAIALTAYAGELDRQHALQVGFQRHVTKPVALIEIAQIIASLVQKSR